MASAQTPRIAIIGGGPSGLVLLLTLHKRGIPATVYERDVTPFSRLHLGGTLDLIWESGQRALRENGLEEVFKANSRPEGDSYKIIDSSANVLLEFDGSRYKEAKDIRPEIDRSTLRRILLDAVPAESVKWDHALSSVRSLGGGTHELTFANGTTTVCDILIGADGAHSRVRPLVSPATALYAGISGAEISLAPEVATREDMSDVRELVGKGTCFALHAGRLLGAQVNSDGRIRTYAFMEGPPDFPLPVDDPDAARRALRAEYVGWSPVLLKLIDHCDDRAIYPRTLYALPVGHKWAHVPGVTIIGDAAHLMTPFAGMGANLAMLDGLECGLVLAEQILAGASPEAREAAVQAWEEKMLARGEHWASITMLSAQGFFSPDAPHAVVAMFKQFMG